MHTLDITSADEWTSYAFLAADLVGLAEVCAECGIDLRGVGEAEVVDVVAGGEVVDAAESRIGDFAFQPQMAVQPVIAGGNGDEAAARLKHDSRLLSVDRHRAQ